MTVQKRVAELLNGCDVRIGGSRPWDIKVHNPHFYARVMAQGALGFGESYMDGWWDCGAIDECVARIMQADLLTEVHATPAMAFAYLRARVRNRQTKHSSFGNAQAHYDIGNDLFTAMLDRRLTYTCGYWKDAHTLDEAQEAKLDLVCRKIGLKAGQRVLDIGCGWGSFAKFAAEKYGVKVVGVTVSNEQVKLGKELCRGLPVELRLQDYRDVHEQFDHIISLGMFEHVGYKNYRSYFETVRRCLAEDGLFLLHTIGTSTTSYTIDPWIKKYIFPNSAIPSIKQIAQAAEKLFIVEDWHSFGAHYDPTLMAWCKNVEARRGMLADRYDEHFYRMWRYYLLSCAGAFRARANQLWQIVFSKNGVPGGYESQR